MRPSLLPGLLKAAQRNADRGYPDTALFEVGQVFRGRQARGPADRRHRDPPRPRHSRKARADTGRTRRNRSMYSTPRATPWRCWRRSACPRRACRSSRGGPAWYHPGRSATLQFGPKVVIGSFGELHPRILEALDVKGPVVACEILLDALPPPKAKPTRMKPKLVLSELPAGLARLRLHRADRDRRRRHPEGGTGRRPPARHRGRRLRSSTRAPASPKARSRSPSPSPCSRATKRSRMPKSTGSRQKSWRRS